MERTYYWIVTGDPKTGQPFLIFGGTSETEARNKGLEMLGGLDFEIKPMPTKSAERASSFLKGNRLEQHQNLQEAKRKVGHNRSLKRLLRKRRSRA